MLHKSFADRITVAFLSVMARILELVNVDFSFIFNGLMIVDGPLALNLQCLVRIGR